MIRAARAVVVLASLVWTSMAWGQTAEPSSEGTRSTEAGKIPITTESDAARSLYLEGRRLAEDLHLAEAHARYAEAVKADPDFALGYYGLATSAPTAAAFFENLERAVALVERASPAERHLILALQAAANNDPETQRKHLTELVAAYPQDERAHFQLANYYNGRQEYERAVEHFRDASEINPGFTPAYNVLGYAYRFLDRNDEAETAFRKYIELVPNEPNPYDSYAELLMRRGRFEESIENYRKALEIDPQFVFSLVGIGNNQIFLGRPADARATFKEMAERAVNDGQRRTALLWTAASYVHEGKRDKALATVSRMTAIAEKKGDLAAASGDLVLMGDIVLETGGPPDEALRSYTKAVEVMERAQAPAEVKEATRRNHLYYEALVALRKGDLDTARQKAAAYRDQAAANGVVLEVQQAHELAGRLALQDGDPAGAVRELSASNQQDPRILWELARAYAASGERDKAQAMAKKTAEFNQLNFGLAYVRSDARRGLPAS